jgi:hypothetical protein
MRGEELEGIRSFLFVVDEVIHSVFVNLVILHLYARKQQFSPKKSNQESYICTIKCMR